MEFKQIQCFVAAAETLNFTTAAERMYLSAGIFKTWRTNWACSCSSETANTSL